MSTSEANTIPEWKKKELAIIDEVKRFNAGYKNTDYGVRTPVRIGGRRIYPVVFKGSNEIWYENYVFESTNRFSGESHFRVYWSLRDLFVDRHNLPFMHWMDPEFMTTFTLASICIILAATICGIVAFSPVDKPLEAITGLFGLALGYLVGKERSTNS